MHMILPGAICTWQTRQPGRAGSLPLGCCVCCLFGLCDDATLAVALAAELAARSASRRSDVNAALVLREKKQLACWSGLPKVRSARPCTTALLRL